MAEQHRRLTTILGHLKASASLSGASTTNQRPPESLQKAYQFTKEGLAEVLSPLDKYRERFKKICTKEVKVGEV